MGLRADRDTIAAIATAPGVGGVGVVRISGRDISDIAYGLLKTIPVPRHALFTKFHDHDGAILDQGIALYFPAPHSFTGESVLELHGHGGPVVLNLLLQRTYQLGARPARPGEFSERAFLNGKLDLVQAEAIADLIEASSAEAARAAMRSLDGEFSRRVHALTESLIKIRMHAEAALDFPDEEIDSLSAPRLQVGAETLIRDLRQLLADANQGQLLHDGMTIVLAGRPNAGKSSLLNLLAQRDSAIVSDIPGTTRDVLREHIQIDGLPLHILDTAGLRATTDEIESEGVRRAHVAMRQADRVLLIVDDTVETDQGISELLQQLPAAAVTIIRNKCDLSGRHPGLVESGIHAVPEISLSAQYGTGLESLRVHLKSSMGYQSAGEGTFSARRRHLEAITRAQHELNTALAEFAAGRSELAAEALRLAQQYLGEITGDFSSDDLLGRIFSSFCIGK